MSSAAATPQAGAPEELSPSKELELPPPTGEEEAGCAVAVNNGLVVVGAQIAKASKDEPSGKVYIFEEEVLGSNKLKLIATLESPEENQGELTTFGSSVAMTDEYIVVGAARETPEELSQAGRAYIFKISAVKSGDRTPHVKLESGTPQANGLFGFSVAISGTNVIVGAPFETAGGVTRAGNVYVFNAETGEPVRMKEPLTSPNATKGGQFGLAVAIEGETAIIGAPSEKYTGGEGRVYIFNANTGAPISPGELTNPGTPTAIESFGSSVAITDAFIVVGDEVYGTPPGIGAVYVYNTSGVYQFTLTNPSSPTRGHFGAWVAITGTQVIVGAPENDEAEPGNGAAYVFDATGGGPTVTFESPETEPPGERTRGAFGICVAVSGSEVLVGASRRERETKELAGNAYFYTLP